MAFDGLPMCQDAAWSSPPRHESPFQPHQRQRRARLGPGRAVHLLLRLQDVLQRFELGGVGVVNRPDFLREQRRGGWQPGAARQSGGGIVPTAAAWGNAVPAANAVAAEGYFRQGAPFNKHTRPRRADAEPESPHGKKSPFKHLQVLPLQSHGISDGGFTPPEPSYAPSYLDISSQVCFDRRVDDGSPQAVCGNTEGGRLVIRGHRNHRKVLES